MEKITLGKEEFKALSAETRLRILKLLSQRNYIQSELSEELGLSAPTLSEHLRLLERASLVKKLEEGRKWKYYELTEKARGILAPEQRTIWLVFMTTIFTLVAGFFWLMKGTMQLGSFAGTAKEAADSAMPVLAAAPAAATAQAASSGFAYGWLIYILVLVVLITLSVILVKKRRAKVRKAVS